MLLFELIPIYPFLPMNMTLLTLLGFYLLWTWLAPFSHVST
jgi:hypothetical protein